MRPWLVRRQVPSRQVPFALATGWFERSGWRERLARPAEGLGMWTASARGLAEEGRQRRAEGPGCGGLSTACEGERQCPSRALRGRGAGRREVGKGVQCGRATSVSR